MSDNEHITGWTGFTDGMRITHSATFISIKKGERSISHHIFKKNNEKQMDSETERKMKTTDVPVPTATGSMKCDENVSINSISTRMNEKNRPRQTRDSNGRLTFDLDKIREEAKNRDSILDMLKEDSFGDESCDNPVDSDSYVEYNANQDVMEDTSNETTEDVWTTLSKRLSSVQKKYILCLLNVEATADLLKSNNVMKGIIENEINSLSQELIDDVLIEDGAVIEDYVDSIRGALNGS